MAGRTRAEFFFIFFVTKKLRIPDSPWPFATIGYWLLESTTPAGLSSALLYRKGHWGIVTVCSESQSDRYPTTTATTNTYYLLAS